MGKLVAGHVLSGARQARGGFVLMEESNGAIAIDEAGIIVAVGKAADVKKTYPKWSVEDYGDRFLMPAFLDIHTHPPQLDIIGSFGKRLLDWLDQFTYPVEEEFALRDIARSRTQRYITAQLQNGVTTAFWFGTTSKVGVDEMFAVADAAGVRAVIGKVSMDQNGPDYLVQEAAADLADLDELRETWHRKTPLLHLALTPRFAPTCSPLMLAGLGRYRNDHSDLFVQTHLSEQLDEIDFAMSVHPGHDNYTSIYRDHNLLSARTVMAHCIHLSSQEVKILNDDEVVVAHCPTSNNFLGSGLCPLHEFEHKGLATDIGGGTTLCMWETMRSAYGIAKLQGQTVTPLELFAMATVYPAEALGWGDKLGALAVGMSADIQVIGGSRNTLLSDRLAHSETAEARLGAVIALGHTGLTEAVYCAGRRVFERQK